MAKRFLNGTTENNTVTLLILLITQVITFFTGGYRLNIVELNYRLNYRYLITDAEKYLGANTLVLIAKVLSSIALAIVVIGIVFALYLLLTKKENNIILSWMLIISSIIMMIVWILICIFAGGLVMTDIGGLVFIIAGFMSITFAYTTKEA